MRTWNCLLSNLAPVTEFPPNFLGSVDEAVLEDEKDRGNSILPADLLPFEIIAPAVGDRDFIDAATGFGDLGREFRLKPEAVFPKFDLLQKTGTEYFVARLHVGQVQVRHHVRKCREHLVAQVMPKEKDAVGTTQEARSIHHIGLVRQYRLDQSGILRRIVLEVGILDNDDVSRYRIEAGPQRGSFPHIARLKNDLQVSGGTKFLKDFAGAIRRTVVHNDDLFGKVYRADTF